MVLHHDDQGRVACYAPHMDVRLNRLSVEVDEGEKPCIRAVRPHFHDAADHWVGLVIIPSPPPVLKGREKVGTATLPKLRSMNVSGFAAVEATPHFEVIEDGSWHTIDVIAVEHGVDRTDFGKAQRRTDVAARTRVK